MYKTLSMFPKFMHEGLIANGWKDGFSRWSDREIIDAWLKWEGIQGFTDLIREACAALPD